MSADWGVLKISVRLIKVEKQWGVEDKLVEEFYNNVAE